MDINFIKEFTPMYAEALKLTVTIAAVGIVLSIIVGVLCSIVRFNKVPVLKTLVNIYVELSRNTPLLIQLFFLYFGLPKIGISLSSESCAIIGLTFLGGGYMAEALKSGLEGVPASQFDSARALGFSRAQMLRYIIFPQAISTSIPAICANIIFLIKETSVFSVVALADLMYVAKDLIGIYYKTDEALLMLVIAYLIILLPISVICSIIERRVRYAEYGD